ncbi:UDP-glucose 4-epimerase GalE [Planococcus liqunii]|uniref:UDP-glucose 4-epimerase n=1 Tax=Planococcus liqunii TaxID=3058394 RepID=A0ABT8MN67_9BACL|nr:MULTISPECIES: UDP-glucose 4-epimerase GalE [unclassified Planococcus (in: firmicutes)]MDN7226341.1 UDP-glucose 4-epimerase GalE [Planococcus sp. N064]WKA50115.1 UDP-glucose 4-epimerase GalE [Planococcus sp. N056]
MLVLVTGGAGYIGSHAAVELLKNGYDIVVMDNLSNSEMEAIKRVKDLTGKDFPFYEADLLDAETMDLIFTQHNIDAVMHFAGLKAVGESVTLPLNYYRNNVIGTLILCEIMKKHNVKKMVFSSSATVYGNPEKVPIDESFPLSATNSYGRTKLIIEEILRDLFISDSTWHIAILRYFNPIGAHKSGRIGESPKGTPNNLMPYITQVAIGKQEQLRIFGDDYKTPDGTGIRDYIHVVDLVKGHVKALQYLENHEGVEIFNLGTGTGYSVLDLVKSFSEATSKNIPYKIVERRPGDIGVCYANAEKAKRLLKWQAEKDLQEMCEDSWRWQSLNPDGFKSYSKSD